jgi:hypothetical protein
MRGFGNRKCLQLLREEDAEKYIIKIFGYEKYNLYAIND